MHRIARTIVTVAVAAGLIAGSAGAASAKAEQWSGVHHGAFAVPAAEQWS